jgi:hypothetical protein
MEARASKVPQLRVFICYSSKDKLFVRKLARDLRAHGLEVWFDEWAMFPGDSLYERIEQGIRTSGWFVIVLSPNSVQSRWCKRELREAMEEEFQRNNVYVIPLLHRMCELPAFLREKMWVDCHGKRYNGALSQLLRTFGRRFEE